MPRLKRPALNLGLSIALILIFSSLVSAVSLRTFENPQLKYSVKYPADFQLKTLGRTIVFILPDIDKKTGFAENINITVGSLNPPVLGLDEFFGKAKENLTMGGSGVKILEEKKDKLGGVDAYRIIYTSKQKKTDFKLLQVICIYKNEAYVVTYTALPEQFSRNLSQANLIIKSLRFTD